jgi:1,4-alpha-glucan branching enzyme
MQRNNLPRNLADDAWLQQFKPELDKRRDFVLKRRRDLRKLPFDWHEYFGLHKNKDKTWSFREWLPNAERVALIGSFNDWNENDPDFQMKRAPGGVWEIKLPQHKINHLDTYGIKVFWNGGEGFRIPATANRVVRQKTQDSQYGVAFHAQVWEPRVKYRWKHQAPKHLNPIIYEAHVGMAQEKEGVGTYNEFTEKILPRIARAGYNTIQLMGIQQHPFYGSFGYHVSSFFAPCDLFGTPDDLKKLVDTAHGLGLKVVMDIVHSHAVKNEIEGIGFQDGTEYLYCHAGQRGWHPAWDSRCFDYGKDATCRFLLSNCKYWLEVFRFDGFRFDGVTSMLYHDHGLFRTFNSYEDYFSGNLDLDAFAYLALANDLIHEIDPNAWTFAEDVSGLPGLAAPIPQGGAAFDFRLAMGVTDLWFKLTDIPDEHWDLYRLWYELINRRQDERTVAYLECHDQAMVGGQSFIFKLIGIDIYTQMHVGSKSLAVDRGIALHKMARLITLATAGHGYLNFMGNEFGHPEWIDFPREGNNWSYHHARRQWSLRDNDELRFKPLADFDQQMLSTITNNREFFNHVPELIWLDQDAKIIVFKRNNLVFAFNFHPTQSQPQFQVRFPEPAQFTPILDTDSELFNGFGRIGHDWTAKTSEKDGNHVLNLYLPCRTALVLSKS